MFFYIYFVIPQRMRQSSTVMEIWLLEDNRGHDLDLLGSRDVIGHVTIRLPWSTSYRWSMLTMRQSGTVTEIWPFEVFQGRLFQKQWSVVGRSVVRSSILH